MVDLTIEQEAVAEFQNKCTITKVGDKYIAQSPHGFYLGKYKTEQEAKDKILKVAKTRIS